jgi:hypothetical protein
MRPEPGEPARVILEDPVVVGTPTAAPRDITSIISNPTRAFTGVSLRNRKGSTRLQPAQSPPQISLAVIKHEASIPSKRVGTILLIPGWAGGTLPSVSSFPALISRTGFTRLNSHLQRLNPVN